jgi:hypothetical protein
MLLGRAGELVARAGLDLGARVDGAFLGGRASGRLGRVGCGRGLGEGTGAGAAAVSGPGGPAG